LLQEEGNFKPIPSLKEGLRVRALFDYEATEDNELSFNAGDIIEDVDTGYETWWYGRKEDGSNGFFPNNFVEMYNESSPIDSQVNPDYLNESYLSSDINPKESIEESIPEQYEGLMGRALYDYEATDETEIGFKEGDIIRGIETIDEGWWRGYDTSGHFGLFPANHLELL
jgi:hypothetical protein